MNTSAHLLGAMATVVLCFLPGAALVSRRWGETLLERIGMVCAVSLGINCFALMLLNVAGIYRAATAWLWLAWLIAGSGLILIVRRARRRPESSRARSEAQVGAPSFPSLQDVLVLPIVLIVLVKTSFFPFSSWDAIASWNRWARAYFLVPDYFHREQFFYPQYHPWAMSFPYMLMRDPTIEYYSHAFAAAYLLVLYAGVSRLARVLGAPGWLAFCVLFLTEPISTWVGTGYADDAGMAFASLSVAFLLESLMRQGKKNGWRALIAGLFAGTAFLFKPSTAAVTLSLPALAVLLLRQGTLLERAMRVGILGLGALLITSPWLSTSQAAVVYPQVRMVMIGIHDSVPRSRVLRTGTTNLMRSGTLLKRQNVDRVALIAAAVFGLIAMYRSRAALCLGIVVLGILPVWVVTANYDARAILPAIPLAVVIATAGLFWMTSRLLGDVRARAACIGVALASLIVIGIAELDPNGALIDRSFFDSRPGERWAGVGLLAPQEEKATMLLPALGALHNWKTAHPGFSSNLWSDAVIAAAFDPRRLNGGARWVGSLFDHEGRPQWRPGDVLFISDAMGREPVRPPWVLGVKMDLTTWEVWLRSMELSNVLRAAGRWGDYSAYEVLVRVDEGPEPTS